MNIRVTAAACCRLHSVFWRCEQSEETGDTEYPVHCHDFLTSSSAWMVICLMSPSLLLLELLAWLTVSETPFSPLCTSQSLHTHWFIYFFFCTKKTVCCLNVMWVEASNCDAQVISWNACSSPGGETVTPKPVLLKSDSLSYDLVAF